MPSSSRVAVYTGSFDPVTLGHLNVIERAAELFDRLVIGVGINTEKRPLFTPQERVELLQSVVSGMPNVEVQTFDGLAVQFVRQCGARVMVRGVRPLTDIAGEFTMLMANRQLDSDVETVFLMADEHYAHVSSSLIKQIRTTEQRRDAGPLRSRRDHSIAPPETGSSSSSVKRMSDVPDQPTEHPTRPAGNARVLARCGVRPHDPFSEIVFQRAAGSRMWDEEGNAWFDLTCGFSVSNFGHAHPRLLRTARKELDRAFHLTGQNNPFRDLLAASLIRWLGEGIEDCRIVFHTGGTRAIETAVRAAAAYRPGMVVSIWPGFHGNAIGTWPISHRAADGYADGLTESGRARVLGEVPPGAEVTDWRDHPTTRSLSAILKNRPQAISAVVVDPSLATRGYLFPPVPMLRWIRDATRRNGILLIADEVQSGLGRCGDWLLCRRDGWAADLVAVGKSLGGGIFPIAALLGPARILDALPPGAVTESFAAAALGCRLGCQVIEMLSDSSLGLFARGEYLGHALRACVERHLAIPPQDGQPRVGGRGAVCTIEFATDAASHQGGRTRAERFVEACRQARVRVHWAGVERTRVVLLPALTMSDDELAEVRERLANVCQRFSERTDT